MENLKTFINFIISIYEEFNLNEEDIERFGALLENFYLEDWNACIEILEEFKKKDKEIC